MLILFDQGTPVAIRHSLPEHVVRTAAEQGWSTLLNGELLRAAEEAGFEVFLTTDDFSPHARPSIQIDQLRLHSRAAENATKRGKSFLQGLKPIESTQFASGLKPRPPEEKCNKNGEKAFFRG